MFPGNLKGLNDGIKNSSYLFKHLITQQTRVFYSDFQFFFSFLTIPIYHERNFKYAKFPIANSKIFRKNRRKQNRGKEKHKKIDILLRMKGSFFGKSSSE